MNTGYIYLFIFCIIASVKPIFIKKYNAFLFTSLVSYTLYHLLGGLLLYYYKHKTIKDKDIENFSPSELYPGFLKSLEILLFVYGSTHVPAYMLVSMSTLRVVTIAFFDKFINKATYDNVKYIEIVGIIFSTIIINISSIFGKKNEKSIKIIGIISILLSVIVRGYIFTRFRNYTIEKQDTSKTMIFIGKGSSVFLLCYILYYFFMGKKIQFPPLKIIATLAVSGFFMYFIAGYAKNEGVSKIPQIQAAIFLKTAIVLSFFVSTWYFKEKMTFIQKIGVFLMICIIVFSIFEKKIIGFIEKKKESPTFI